MSIARFSVLPGRMEKVAVPALLLIGFGLRVFRLDVQSIWYDEGFSIDLARHSPSEIIGLAAADIHPPLHALLLHFWMLLAGDSEFSVRFVSVFFGVLVVAVLFQLGRFLSAGKGALLTLAVSALAPFLVYYSQEARPYSPGLFFVVLAALACLKWLRQSRSRVWLACYVGATVAAVYTHYYAWLMVAALNLFVLMTAWPSVRKAITDLRFWWVAQVVVGVAFLPWAGTLIQKYDGYSTPLPPPDILNVLYQLLASFGLGYTAGQAGVYPAQRDILPDHWVVVGLTLAFLAVAAYGIVRRVLVAPAREGGMQRVFLALYVAVPVVALILLSWGKRYIEPRYFLFAAPAYYLMLGRGAGLLFSYRRLLGVLSLLLILGASALSLNNYYFKTEYWRDDVRGTVRFVESRLGDNDAVILNAFYFRHTFMYYYRGKAPVVDLPAQMPANWDQDLPVLEALAGRYDRVWLVLWQDYFTDPQRQVQGRFERHGIRFEHRSFRAPVNVVGYYTRPPLVQGTPEGQPVGIELGGAIELAAFRVPEAPVCAGGDAGFTVYWRALHPITSNYTAFVHLIDRDGRKFAQADSPPVNGGYPTTRWPAGALVADERWIGVPDNTPPGEYYVLIGMYDPATMKRLGEGDPGPLQYTLGPLQVVPTGSCG